MTAFQEFLLLMTQASPEAREAALKVLAQQEQPVELLGLPQPTP